tara:strand:+ start:1537 stop:2025 length:489 start_codon:yes stop_codon:yes gene_type:complete
MAITASTLTTTVSETITLNGQTFGNTITKTHAGIKDVLIRTIVVPHGSAITSLYTVSTTEGGSAFSPTDLKYVRITNTDTTNALSIFIENEAGHEVLYKLNAGCSFVINGHEDSLMVEATSGTDLSGDNDGTYAAGSAAIVSVKAQAFGSANVDVELLVASA